MAEGGAGVTKISTAFVWEHHPWLNHSNSENSGGGDDEHGGDDDQQKSGGKKKKGSSSSNSLQTTQGAKKRGRGGVGKNGKGSSTGTTRDGGGEVIKQGKVVGGESDHEIHIWTERERRKKMRNMFANLHALLPQLPPKVDKSTIVDEAVKYIKNLEQTLHKLQKQKLEKLQSATTTINYEASTIAPQRLLGYDIQSSREAFLADQGSCSTTHELASTTTTTTTTDHHVVVVPSTASLISTHHSPVIFQTWTSSNVVLNICGEEAHISVCSPKKPGIFSTICYILRSTRYP
ncbi:hypothetical protein FNV43_RR22511 [Rhamnella rubrinervis]|uniref:BHLH domain-containing protein n=1 Tax=Rhamnella rubrinervis TaxID=2594499 RepID=A0A8K0DQC5_9ROSA|nr:hypothetical protein FNV43_RR22511 [Rhamnella rubrinervis]